MTPEELAKMDAKAAKLLKERNRKLLAFPVRVYCSPGGLDRLGVGTPLMVIEVDYVNNIITLALHPSAAPTPNNTEDSGD